LPLGTFVAGRYSSTYLGIAVGITRTGYEITHETKGEDIAETDQYGLSVIDNVWRGGDVTCDWVSVEYRAGSLASFWPYGSVAGGAGILGQLYNPNLAGGGVPVGQLASNLAAVFALAVTAGTPAVNNPNTLAATLAILRPGYPAKLLFNSKLREVPISLRFYPYNAGANVIQHYVLT
jgi:hypothetical protein